MTIRPVGTELFRADGRTDMTELIDGKSQSEHCPETSETNNELTLRTVPQHQMLDLRAHQYSQALNCVEKYYYFENRGFYSYD